MQSMIQDATTLKVTLRVLSLLDVDDLDEMVMDMAYCNANPLLNETEDLDAQESILKQAENTASNINNMGKDAQVKYLIGNGFRARLNAS